jgi:hypothetical protein
MRDLNFAMKWFAGLQWAERSTVAAILKRWPKTAVGGSPTLRGVSSQDQAPGQGISVSSGHKAIWRAALARCVARLSSTGFGVSRKLKMSSSPKGA